MVTMDTRVYETALNGNTYSLQQLMRENPLILDNIVPFGVENPLHVASNTGQTDFVKHILRVKPDFAKEVNQEGLTPMHMAAGNGHVEIVKELILVDSKLCRLEGREKRTPLHYASANGQVKVISEMLLCCPDCIGDVTVQRETALHLAVKNNQFKATTTLIEFVKEKKKEDIMNLKDEQGNTALHLAVWKKQRQMIELLLDSEATKAELSEVNTVNHSGLTALDVLLCFPSEAGDREILQILQAAGATRDVCIPSSGTTSHQSSDNTSTPRARRSKFNNLVDYFKFKKGRDSPSEARGTLLVTACLVATTTFQVGVSPPGGVWQETFTPDPNNSSSSRSSSNNNTTHIAGRSILGTTDEIAFTLFTFFNSMGFSMSLFMIGVLTSRFPLQFELQICLIAMYCTYNTAVINTTPGKIKIYIIIITILLSSSMSLIARLVRQLTMKLTKPRRQN